MAAPQDKRPQVFVDTLGTFEGGVNTYPPPLLLSKNQLSSALNTTLRKDFVTQRSVLRQITFDATSQTLLNSAISAGFYQGGCYFKPDSGPEGIANAIAGRLISIFPNQDQKTASATEITGYSAAGTPQTKGQSWLWQSELWVIWNDGVNNPVFYNTNAGNSVRSTYGTPVNHNTQVTNPFTIAPPGTPTTGVVLTSTANMSVNDTLTLLNFGNVVVLKVYGDGVTVDIMNINIRPGSLIPATGGVYWSEVSSTQLPPGRMGAYGLGRNWFSLKDGIHFVASDIVGGSSGTQAFNFRDAVLNITENAFLAGGGTFVVPGAGEEIMAFAFPTTLDQSLGQGALQVLTRDLAFSCQTPTDRLTWQDVNNPILTVSDNNGATGKNSTVPVNGDLTFRSIDGLRSLILARRDIDVWGNVPISREIQSLLDSDNQTLLNWGSAIVFDNRLLVTATPSQIAQGVIHTAIVPLNLDPLSSLRGKQPSIYDSERWTGLNVFQLFVGSFADLTRAFAVCWNTQTNNVELYEILRTSDTTYLDNDVQRIVWSFNTASLFKETGHIYKRLIDGEIYVDDLQGTVDFQIWFRPDQYPCFTPWIAWQECQEQPTVGNQPGFRPRMGLGEPPIGACDPVNNRPLAEFFTMQIRGIITGKCRFLGGQFKAAEADQPEYAAPQCVQSCPP